MKNKRLFILRRFLGASNESRVLILNLYHEIKDRSMWVTGADQHMLILIPNEKNNGCVLDELAGVR
ncbi:MAG: hypothetical protein ACRENZ_07835 [Thermodesulfobacteriota bacterium]